MDKIEDLLADKNIYEPPEIGLIKDFVKKKFNSNAEVVVAKNQVTISVSNAALAAQLRNEIVLLKKMVDTDKRLVIFIR